MTPPTETRTAPVTSDVVTLPVETSGPPDPAATVQSEAPTAKTIIPVPSGRLVPRRPVLPSPLTRIAPATKTPLGKVLTVIGPKPELDPTAPATLPQIPSLPGETVEVKLRASSAARPATAPAEKKKAKLTDLALKPFTPVGRAENT